MDFSLEFNQLLQNDSLNNDCNIKCIHSRLRQKLTETPSVQNFYAGYFLFLSISILVLYTFLSHCPTSHLLTDSFRLPIIALSLFYMYVQAGGFIIDSHDSRMVSQCANGLSKSQGKATCETIISDSLVTVRLKEVYSYLYSIRLIQNIHTNGPSSSLIAHGCHRNISNPQ